MQRLPFALLAALSFAAICPGSLAAQDTDGAAVNPGAFLAARVAESNNDFADAARWFSQAAEADPGNPRLITGEIYAQLALGEVAKAADLATALKLAGGTSQTADIALLAQQAKAEDYAGILAAAADGRKLGSALMDDLIRAWAELGNGNSSQALAAFDAMAKTPGLEAFGLYHKALALASAGDFEGADKILSGQAEGPIGVLRNGLIAHVQILSQLEQNPVALDLLNRNFGTAPDPQIDDLRTRLAAGEPIAFDTINTARDGIAEVFFTVASALRGEADEGYVLIHSRIATYLRPDFSDGILTSAALLENMDQHDLAVAAYAQIPADHPSFYVAEIGRAETLYDSGQKQAGIEVLRALSRSHGSLVVVHTALGDMLRRDEAFADAVAAYDAALALVPEPDANHWGLFFSRGICHEQLKDWPRAEPDFRKALALNPGQPQVLNYLGYSFVDRGENLTEALTLIEQAVAAQPEAGYIIDSLAWAYFRLGRYEDALAPMEKASLLEPVDPVVTDHLGDVYWAVGRKMEARFQWRRALSFNPSEKDTDRIRRKLEVGLDEVLKQEGAPPIVLKGAAVDGG